MKFKRREQPKVKTSITQDVQAYVKKRAENREVKAVEAKKHVEIQLLLSELENMLLNMSQSDTKILAIRSKLLELKIAFYKTLDIQ